MNNAQKPTSNGSSESFQAQSVEEKQTKPSGIRKEDKAINDDHELISDEDKCRNNWSKGVQSTEDFFAGKGHPKKEPKTENTTCPQNDQNTKTEQPKDIETKSTDTPKNSTKLFRARGTTLMPFSPKLLCLSERISYEQDMPSAV